MARTAHNSDLDSCGLSFAEIQELWLGCPHDGSNFASTAALKQAWEQNRGLIMRLFATNGHRPQIWWCLDAPRLELKWPGRDREQSYLYDHGILSPEEKTGLTHAW